MLEHMIVRDVPPAPTRRGLVPDLREDFRFMLQCEQHDLTSRPRALALCAGYVLARPGASAVVLYRLSRALYRAHLVPLAYVLARLNQVLHGIEIPPTVEIGPGFVIYHPSGIVLHGEVVVGARFRIHTGNVLGIRQSQGGTVLGPPTVGNDVLLGTGAKLLGGFHVGDGASVGANAVVVKDVPAGASAIGIPAVVRLPVRGG
jgi:serine O-acetyltransferase